MHFDVLNDVHKPDSIQLLKDAGLDFQKHAKMGINQEIFREYFINSGLVRNTKLTWIAFNSCFDFAFMIKILIGNYAQELPFCKYEFLKQCNYFFPNFYDVK